VCDFGITQYVNDAESVAAWVAGHQDGHNTLVRYAKFPGEVDDECGLGEQDFMLVIMSSAQLQAYSSCTGQ